MHLPVPLHVPWQQLHVKGVKITVACNLPDIMKIDSVTVFVPRCVPVDALNIYAIHREDTIMGYLRTHTYTNIYYIITYNL